jgi:hypothetical protein
MEYAKAYRTSLLKNGYLPVPLFIPRDGDDKSGGKIPVGKAWPTEARSRIGQTEWNEPIIPLTSNTGILCDGLRVIDVDVDDPTLVGEITDLMIELFGLPVVVRTRGSSCRFLTIYRPEYGEPTKRMSHNKETGYKVEILGKGQQCMVDGLHYSGDRVAWAPEDGLAEIARDQLPIALDNNIEIFLQCCDIILGVKEDSRDDVTYGTAKRAPYTGGESDRPPMSESDIADLVDNISNNNLPYEENDRLGKPSWLGIISAIYNATDGSLVGKDIARGWSSKSGKHVDSDFNKKWSQLEHGAATAHNVGHLVNIARAQNPDWIAPSIAERLNKTDEEDLMRALDRLKRKSFGNNIRRELDF